MKKKLWAGLAVGVMVLGMTGMASATLVTIGTAGYDSNGDSVKENHNLIWDNDNNGNSVVWLDYTNSQNTWAYQKDWTARLNTAGEVSYSLFAGYSVDWGSNAWRLPVTLGTNEMSHLFYNDLGNSAGSYDVNGNFVSGLKNKGPFSNLLDDDFYWSGSELEFAPGFAAYIYSFGAGVDFYNLEGWPYYALAMRNGDVSAPVPVPATILLLGTGLAGLIGARRKKKK